MFLKTKFRCDMLIRMIRSCLYFTFVVALWTISANLSQILNYKMVIQKLVGSGQLKLVL